MSYSYQFPRQGERSLGPVLCLYTFFREGFVLAYNAQPFFPLMNFPKGTSYERWAMLHDGKHSRIFFLEEESDGEDVHLTLLQGTLNAENRYQYDFYHDGRVPILEAPAQLSTSSFAMFHDGEVERLFFKSEGAPNTLIQFEYVEPEKAFLYKGEDGHIQINPIPDDLDPGHWTLGHNGTDYELFHWKKGAVHTQLYRSVFSEGTRQDPQDGKEVPVQNLPDNLNTLFSPNFSVVGQQQTAQLFLLHL